MVGFRSWIHSVDAVKKVAEENSYECKVHSDYWVHYSDPERLDTMLSFQLRE